MHYVEKLLQSLQPLYSQPWFPFALGIVGLIFAYSVFMTLKSLPKMVMYPIIMATAAIVMMNWIYNRTEPEFLTPLIEMLTPWLPSQ